MTTLLPSAFNVQVCTQIRETRRAPESFEITPFFLSRSSVSVNQRRGKRGLRRNRGRREMSKAEQSVGRSRGCHTGNITRCVIAGSVRAVMPVCPSEQHPHRLAQPDHCDLGRDGTGMTMPGAARAFQRPVLPGQPVQASLSLLSHSCGANLVVSGIQSKSNCLFPHCACSCSTALAGVFLTPWTSSYGN